MYNIIISAQRANGKCGYWNHRQSNEFFAGMLDDVRVYNRAETSGSQREFRQWVKQLAGGG